MDKSSSTKVTIVGLGIGTVGIAGLWAFGQVFPIYPPPGIIILVAGALVIALTKLKWAPAIGAALGLFVTVGTLISPDGLDNLAGDNGAGIAIGQSLQAIGVVTALVAGIIATRNNYQKKVSVGDR